MSVSPTYERSDESQFLFSRRMRRWFWYLALFVLYSQLASAGLTGVYRYWPWERTFLDGGNPSVFDPYTLTLLQPPLGVGTIENWRAVGRDLEFSWPAYAAWAIVAPALGSAGLFFATVAGKGWLPRCLLLLGSCLGVVAAVAIKLYEWFMGSIGWAFLAGVITDRTLPHVPHPIYGHAELAGSLFLPLGVYASIVFFLVISSARRAFRSWIAARRQGNQRR